MRKVRTFKHVKYDFEIWQDDKGGLHVETPEDPFYLAPDEYELKLIDAENKIYELEFNDYDIVVVWEIKEVDKWQTLIF